MAPKSPLSPWKERRFVQQFPLLKKLHARDIRLDSRLIRQHQRRTTLTNPDTDLALARSASTPAFAPFHPDSPTFDRGRMHTLRSRGSIPGPVGPTRRKRYRDPITGGGGERPTVVIANRLVETPAFADMNLSRGSARRSLVNSPGGMSGYAASPVSSRGGLGSAGGAYINMKTGNRMSESFSSAFQWPSAADGGPAGVGGGGFALARSQSTPMLSTGAPLGAMPMARAATPGYVPGANRTASAQFVPPRLIESVLPQLTAMDELRNTILSRRHAAGSGDKLDAADRARLARQKAAEEAEPTEEEFRRMMRARKAEEEAAQASGSDGVSPKGSRGSLSPKGPAPWVPTNSLSAKEAIVNQVPHIEGEHRPPTADEKRAGARARRAAIAARARAERRGRPRFVSGRGSAAAFRAIASKSFFYAPDDAALAVERAYIADMTMKNAAALRHKHERRHVRYKQAAYQSPVEKWRLAGGGDPRKNGRFAIRKQIQQLSHELDVMSHPKLARRNSQVMWMKKQHLE